MLSNLAEMISKLPDRDKDILKQEQILSSIPTITSKEEISNILLMVSSEMVLDKVFKAINTTTLTDGLVKAKRVMSITFEEDFV